MQSYTLFIIYRQVEPFFLYFSQASEQEKIATGAQTEDKLQRKEAMLPVKIYQLILKINQLIRKIYQLIWY